MSPSPEFHEPPGLRVTVNSVTHRTDLPAPPDRPHSFVYSISIHNGTPSPVTIKGRKWVVTDDRGEVSAVEGDGVVGQFPTIVPGDSFTYSSRHLLDLGSATAEGSYLGTDGDGRRVLVRIPRFTMTVPDV